MARSQKVSISFIEISGIKHFRKSTRHISIRSLVILPISASFLVSASSAIGAGSFDCEFRCILVAAFKVPAPAPFSDELLYAILPSGCPNILDRAKQCYPGRINARQIPAEADCGAVSVVRMKAHFPFPLLALAAAWAATA